MPYLPPHQEKYFNFLSRQFENWRLTILSAVLHITQTSVDARAFSDIQDSHSCHTPKSERPPEPGSDMIAPSYPARIALTCSDNCI
jgi:hypothetical protein